MGGGYEIVERMGKGHERVGTKGIVVGVGLRYW